MIADRVAEPDTRPFEIRYTEYRAALTCMLCGTQFGVLVSAFPIHDVAPYKCKRCGGSVVVSETETVLCRKPCARMYEDTDKPRIGRPPTWLVEQRRRERERYGEQGEDLVS